MNNKEKYDIKYMAELIEYADTYFFALINEIFVGVSVNLGMPEKDAYKLAKTRPGDLQKAGFFKNIFDKFKGVFNHKVPKFRYNKKRIYGDGKPMTPDQWDIFSKNIDAYWKTQANKVAEDLGVKAFVLGKETTNFREKKKPYENKSLFQVAKEQFKKGMPENISDAYKDYNFRDSEKKIIQQSQSQIAMYVSKTNDEIKQAIRNQVQIAIDENKTSIQLASDLYWEVQKGDLTNKYTAETLQRNWNRVASTELAFAHEAGVLSEYDSEAMESIKDPKKAVYMVRTGGTCEWCRSKQGTIVRLLPKEVISDNKDESLSSVGIEDPNTDIAIWAGKNNIGLKQKEWNICCPAHPYNVATFQRIDLNSEKFNPKTGRVEPIQKKSKYVPQLKDVSYRSQEEKDYRKPTFIGADLVRYNNNVYEAVDHENYINKKLARQKDARLPIPVDKNSTDYKQIFGEAERNK